MRLSLLSQNWRKALPQGRAEIGIASATLIDSAGTGLLLTTSVLYLTHYAGLSATEVGNGLALAGVLGLAASIPGGRLGDRLGFRRALIGLNVLRGLLVLCYLLIRSFPVFLVVVSFIGLVDAATSPCRGGYISQVFGASRRVVVSAYNRAVFNVGISVGAAGATVAVVIGTRAAFEWLIVGDAASYLLAAAILAMLRRGEEPKASAPRGGIFEWRVLALVSASSVALSILAGVINIEEDVLAIGLPLWIVTRTSAPHPLVGILLILNTAIVIALQVRASHGTETWRGAATVGFRGGLALCLGCALCATTGPLTPALATSVLVVAVVSISIGEIWGSAAAWGLAYGLAPDERAGEFLGVWGIGSQAGSVAGPAIVTGCLILGPVGWLVLGLLFLLAGRAQLPVGYRAVRGRLTAQPEDKRT